MTSNILCPAPTIRLYDDPSAFQTLKEDWRSLFERHGDWNVFLSWEWFHCWWECFGDGHELQILTLSSQERLVGLVPMMVETDEQGRRQLALIGSDRTTDSGDLLVEPEFVKPLCEALADFVQRGFGRWERVEFRSLPSFSPLLDTFVQMARTQGMMDRVVASCTCPISRLAPTWDDYLATLGKNDRHEIRRKIRRSQAAGTQSFRRLRTPDEVDAGLPAFFHLHRASRPDKAAFLDESMASFFRSVGRAFAIEGWIQLNLMAIDGREVAASMAFSRGDRVLLYNSGLDPEYRAHSVGIALHAADMQEAIAEGKEWYDFLRGNEPYKYDLGARDNSIYTLNLLPASEGAADEGGY